VTRKQNFFGQVVGAADVTVLCVTYIAAYSVRAKMWLHGYPVLPIARAGANAWILTVAFPAWLIAFRYFNLYSPITYRSVATTISKTIKANILGAVLMLNTIFIMRGFAGASRALLALMIVFSSVALVGEKLAVIFVMRYRWRLRRPSTAWRVLLVGSRSDAQNYLEMVREHPEWNLEIVDVVSAYRDETGLKGVSGNLYPTIER
jgi:FlaA1/EpsC-like NDP-sugar epimerase